MLLQEIRVKNFRILEDFSFKPNSEFSLIVGKNNTGKTSVITVLEKMLIGKASDFNWNDISILKQDEIFNLFHNNNINNTSIDLITLQLIIEYNDSDSFKEIQKFILDLNPDNNKFMIELKVFLDEIAISEITENLKRRNISDKEKFFLYMRKCSHNYYKFIANAVKEPFDESSIRERVFINDVNKVINIYGINASRDVSNNKKMKKLSRLFNEYYETMYPRSKKSNTYEGSNEDRIKEDSCCFDLENVISKFDHTLSELYNKKDGLFSELKNNIKKYSGKDGVNIRIDSNLSEQSLFSYNTILHYETDNNIFLPENHNGLGYLNIISILVEVEINIIKSLNNKSNINIFYIEEPEAHTHPQLQYIFINRIKHFIDEYKNNNFQFILTTHSPHILSKCQSQDIIYFKKHLNNITVNYFKDILDDKNNDFHFMKNYFTVLNSEIFFADKIICVEGNTERILLPAMLSKVDEKYQDYIPLLSQHISIIEMATYSYLFKKIFEFIDVKVLIITDIDPVKLTKNNKGNNKWMKCDPNKNNLEELRTANSTLKSFFGKEANIKELKNKTNQDKIFNSNIRISYQIPEDNIDYQPSTFEDSFICKNIDFLSENLKQEYINELEDIISENPHDYLEIAKKISSKAKFASNLLYLYLKDKNNSWELPKYIEEGLLWLKQN